MNEIIEKSSNKILTEKLLNIIIENSCDEFFDLAKKIDQLRVYHTNEDLKKILSDRKLDKIKNDMKKKMGKNKKKLINLIDLITDYQVSRIKIDYNLESTWKMTIKNVEFELIYRGDNEGQGKWTFWCDEYASRDSNEKEFAKYIKQKFELKNIANYDLMSFILGMIYDTDGGMYDIYEYIF